MASLAQLLAGSIQPISNSVSGRQAANQTYLKYAPLFEALLTLRHQKAQEYETGRKAAAYQGIGAAQGIEGVARQYQSQLQTAFPGAGGGAINDKLGISPAAVSGALAQMAAMQRASVPSSQANLRSNYLNDQGQVTNQILSTLRQAGAANEGSFLDLSQQRRKEAQAARQFQQRLGLDTAKYQETSAYHQAQLDKPPSASEQKTAADLKYFQQHGYYPPTGPPKNSSLRMLPGGVKPLSQGQHNTLSNLATQAKTWAGRLLPHLSGSPSQRRHQVVGLLLTGAKGSGGGSVPKIGNELAVSVGLDMAQFGHVTNGTARRLHAAGYSVQGLNLPGDRKGRNPYSGLH